MSTTIKNFKYSFPTQQLKDRTQNTSPINDLNNTDINQSQNNITIANIVVGLEKEELTYDDDGDVETQRKMMKEF